MEVTPTIRGGTKIVKALITIHFNGYDLWAGGQPDFQYAVSGDTSDYMYSVLGVASFGFEIGEKF
jgi:hypothetical protein